MASLASGVPAAAAPPDELTGVCPLGVPPPPPYFPTKNIEVSSCSQAPARPQASLQPFIIIQQSASLQWVLARVDELFCISCFALAGGLLSVRSFCANLITCQTWFAALKHSCGESKKHGCFIEIIGRVTVEDPLEITHVWGVQARRPPAETAPGRGMGEAAPPSRR